MNVINEIKDSKPNVYKGDIFYSSKTNSYIMLVHVGVEVNSKNALYSLVSLSGNLYSPNLAMRCKSEILSDILKMIENGELEHYAKRDCYYEVIIKNK